MSEYAKRDHMAQGEHYVRHVSAMTAEWLHAKSAIAAELAHRDIEIDRLRAENAALRKDAERYRWLRVGRMEFGVQPGDPDNPPREIWRWYVDFEPDEADRIIDAAMARSAA